MDIYCPNCKQGESLMVVSTYQYGWLDRKPNQYTVEMECLKCDTAVKLSPIIVESKGK